MTGALVLLPSLRATVVGERVELTGKFSSGVQAYVDAWDGPVRVLMEPTPQTSVNLDNETVDPTLLPFTLEVIDYDDAALDTFLRDAAVVHGALGYRQNHLPGRCAAMGVPFVTSSEYTLKTRLQIVASEVGRGLRRARRAWWERGQERANRDAVQTATGIQCNGTPTFEAYRELSASPMLYFDTRTHDADVLTDEALERRLRRVMDGEPLRLAFTGRLDPMKGVQHLLPLARRLRALGVRFTLAICGGGSLDATLRDELRARPIAEVEMKGVLDFQTELVPFVKREVDLFVCPHVQGDPSCTYMETMACGVPIVGFDNEAFQGIIDRAPVGWLSPLGDTEALAERIAQVDRMRGILAERSRVALAMAREHTYEATFARRVAHLREHART